jgi:hypothetical protein
VTLFHARHFGSPLATFSPLTVVKDAKDCHHEDYDGTNDDANILGRDFVWAGGVTEVVGRVHARSANAVCSVERHGCRLKVVEEWRLEWPAGMQ